jgi:hypothetical protein
MALKSKRLFLPSRDELVGFGLIVNQWAKFETLIEYTIAALFRLEDFNSRLFTSGMTYVAKRDLLRVMIEYPVKLKAPEGSPFYTDLSEILNEAEKLVGTRNEVAHSIWIAGTRPDTIKPIRFRARGRLQVKGHDPKEQDFAFKELISIGLDIGDLTFRLAQAALKYRVFNSRFASKSVREAILTMQFARPSSQNTRSGSRIRDKPKARKRAPRA